MKVYFDCLIVEKEKTKVEGNKLHFLESQYKGGQRKRNEDENVNKGKKEKTITFELI